MRDASSSREWPRIVWWGSGPMRWWWSMPLLGAVGWMAASVLLQVFVSDRPLAGSLAYGAVGAAAFAAVGLVLGRIRYRRWLSDATATGAPPEGGPTAP